MLLIDVNVLVYAYREDSPNHSAYNRWLTDTVSSGEPFGLGDLVLSGSATPRVRFRPARRRPSYVFDAVNTARSRSRPAAGESGALVRILLIRSMAFTESPMLW
jgi:uncharacterized protein